MNFHINKSRLKIILFVFISIFILCAPINNVKAVQDQVQISGKIYYTIVIKVYPEKRIPATNNWENQNVIEFRPASSSTVTVSQVVQMNSNGVGTMTVDPSVLTPGVYDITVKGYSHLKRIYTQYAIGTQNTIFIDLSTTGKRLLAGDVAYDDNYINALDISNEATHLYQTTNIKTDLNRDNIVNSLDFSDLATNSYTFGDN